MKYLHCEPYRETLIRHWGNEVENEQDEGYALATYQIRQIGTGRIYDEAIDIPNERRIEMGLEPYNYEVTDIPIENEEEE